MKIWKISIKKNIWNFENLKNLEMLEEKKTQISKYEKSWNFWKQKKNQILKIWKSRFFWKTNLKIENHFFLNPKSKLQLFFRRENIFDQVLMTNYVDHSVMSEKSRLKKIWTFEIWKISKYLKKKLSNLKIWKILKLLKKKWNFEKSQIFGKQIWKSKFFFF